jgi:hypothetical protein
MASNTIARDSSECFRVTVQELDERPAVDVTVVADFYLRRQQSEVDILLAMGAYSRQQAFSSSRHAAAVLYQQLQKRTDVEIDSIVLPGMHMGNRQFFERKMRVAEWLWDNR